MPCTVAAVYSLLEQYHLMQLSYTPHYHISNESINNNLKYLNCIGSENIVSGQPEVQVLENTNRAE